MSKTFESVPMKKDGLELMSRIKEKATELEALYLEVIPNNVTISGDATRCIAVARTNLEQSVMWAIKGVSRQ